MIYCSSLFRFQMQGDIELLNTHLLEQGVLIWEGRNCFFSTAHSDDDIAFVMAAVKRCVEMMYADGWLKSDEKIRSIRCYTDFTRRKTSRLSVIKRAKTLVDVGTISAGISGVQFANRR